MSTVSTAIYDIGDTAVLKSTWNALNPATGIRTLTTPDTADLHVTPPASPPFTLTLLDDEIVVDSAGKLHALIPCTEAGNWKAKWVGTGAAAGAEPHRWKVREDP